jgi:chitin deacetylase
MAEALLFLALVVAATAVGSYLLRRRAEKRKWSVWLGTFVLAFVALGAGAYVLMNHRTFQLFGGLVRRVETPEKLVALTFDDGPRSPFTEEVLEILKARGAKATFFVVGDNLQREMDLARRVVREGHELGNHSFSHSRMVFKSLAFCRDEIESTDRLIRQSGHQGPIHFRPPNGKRLLVLPYALSQMGKRSIFMDVEPDSDPQLAKNADAMTEHVLGQTRPGSIILLHVENRSRREGMKAVPRIVDGLKAKGYRFVTVSELLAAGTSARP